ncbi:MAG: hypothetical protein JO138_11605 [Acidobacteriaceae bacterium]|nr:hypothetical protein [Acidobacteriaceae bacterium]
MPSKNVDVLAIALLLLACFFFAQVRNAVRFELGAHRIGFTNRHVGPIIVVPEPPRPPLPFARD